MKKNREFRRSKAMERLVAQLKSNDKTVKQKVLQKEDLTVKDINRINKEINVLSESYKGYKKTNRKYSK